MSIIAGIIGVILIFIVLGDAFETVVFPRRVTRKLRLVRYFYRASWRLWFKTIHAVSSGKRLETQVRRVSAQETGQVETL